MRTYWFRHRASSSHFQPLENKALSILSNVSYQLLYILHITYISITLVSSWINSQNGWQIHQERNFFKLNNNYILLSVQNGSTRMSSFFATRGVNHTHIHTRTLSRIVPNFQRVKIYYFASHRARINNDRMEVRETYLRRCSLTMPGIFDCTNSVL